MIPKRFDMMSDLEAMVLEDIAKKFSSNDKAVIFNGQFNSKEKVIDYRNAQYDYWEQYFDYRSSYKAPT